jgi:hypothetical protein
MPHEFEVTVKGEIGRIYDLTSEYFTSLGYRVIRADRPNALSFTKGSWLFLRAIFSGGKRNLAVSMMPKGDEVAIHCTYKMPAFWVEFWIESADKAKLQLEVEGLRNLVNQSVKV